jgi:hypothetical protein
MRAPGTRAIFVRLSILAVSAVLLLGVLGVEAQGQLPPPAKPLPTLTHVNQIRGLSAEQAELGYPVLIRGVITMDAPAPDFFVQDATAGIFVEGSVSP